MSWSGPAKTAKEQVAAWDAGESIWSIEMGGLGPGYEQAIQILAVEIVRDEIDNPLPEYVWNGWGDSTVTRIDANRECGGFSGAQVGAAKHLAYHWIKTGPAALFKSCKDTDRHIQVSRFWPKAPEVKP